MALLILTGAAIPAARWITANRVVDTNHAALRAFIVALAPVTSRGERITLVVPAEDRDQDTLAYRARYLLPDRYIELAGPEGGTAQRPDVIAFWRVTPPPSPGRRRLAVGEGFVLR